MRLHKFFALNMQMCTNHFVVVSNLGNRMKVQMRLHNDFVSMYTTANYMLAKNLSTRMAAKSYKHNAQR